MNVILRNRSALEFWRNAALVEARFNELDQQLLKQGIFLNEEMPDSAACQLLAQVKRSMPAQFKTSIRKSECLALASKYHLQLPLHIHSKRKSTDRPEPWLVSHHAPLAARQLVRVEAGVFVVAPEQCLLDLAGELGKLDLLLVACELAGIYSIDEQTGKLPERTQMLTRECLEQLLEETPQVRGAQNAHFAARYLVERARSPREVALALLCALPYRSGGANLPAPKLNYAVKLGKQAAELYGAPECECDLCWPDARLAVFYESDSEHLNRHQLANDARRDAALQAEGVEALRVTAEQLANSKQANEAIGAIAQKLGCRIRPRCADYAMRQEALRQRVL